MAFSEDPFTPFEYYVLQDLLSLAESLGYANIGPGDAFSVGETLSLGASVVTLRDTFAISERLPAPSGSAVLVDSAVLSEPRNFSLVFILNDSLEIVDGPRFVSLAPALRDSGLIADGGGAVSLNTPLSELLSLYPETYSLIFTLSEAWSMEDGGVMPGYYLHQDEAGIVESLTALVTCPCLSDSASLTENVIGMAPAPLGLIDAAGTGELLRVSAYVTLQENHALSEFYGPLPTRVHREGFGTTETLRVVGVIALRDSAALEFLPKQIIPILQENLCLISGDFGRNPDAGGPHSAGVGGSSASAVQLLRDSAVSEDAPAFVTPAVRVSDSAAGAERLTPLLQTPLVDTLAALETLGIPASSLLFTLRESFGVSDGGTLPVVYTLGEPFALSETLRVQGIVLQIAESLSLTEGRAVTAIHALSDSLQAADRVSGLATLIGVNDALGLLDMPAPTDWTPLQNTVFQGRANTALGTVPDGWVDEQGGVWQITGGALKATPTGTTPYYVYCHLTRPASENRLNQRIVFTTSPSNTTSSQFFGFLRHQASPHDFYFAQVNCSTQVITLYRYVGGGLTSLGTVSFVFTAGQIYRYELTAKGAYPTTLTVVLTNLNTGVQVTQTVTDSSASLQAAGGAGIGINGTSYFYEAQTFAAAAGAANPAIIETALESGINQLTSGQVYALRDAGVITETEGGTGVLPLGDRGVEIADGVRMTGLIVQRAETFTVSETRAATPNEPFGAVAIITGRAGREEE